MQPPQTRCEVFSYSTESCLSKLEFKVLTKTAELIITAAESYEFAYHGFLHQENQQLSRVTSQPMCGLLASSLSYRWTIDIDT